MLETSCTNVFILLSVEGLLKREAAELHKLSVRMLSPFGDSPVNSCSTCPAKHVLSSALFTLELDVVIALCAWLAIFTCVVHEKPVSSAGDGYLFER
jgi:hypothetical protein